MRTLLVCVLAFLGSASSLQAADPFVGTWNLNVAKSKPAPAPPGMAAKEETVIIQQISDRYEVTVSVDAQGKAFKGLYRLDKQ